jgi:SAM-dependent methyltransferase
VLEAGGGKRTNIDLPDRFLTTIDIEPATLELNDVADEKILGDIQIYDYAGRTFDLIVCWDVLEHVSSPKAAIAQLSGALAPGGLLLIKGPVISSLKALITRMTPHAAHVAFYRHVLGSTKAGEPGYAPFPAALDADAGDTMLDELLRANGLNIIESRRFEGAQAQKLRERAALIYGVYAFAGRLVGTATRGRWGTLETDFYVIAQKPLDLRLAS